MAKDKKFLFGVVLGIASVLTCCAGDKDLLRSHGSQSSTSQVFSSSIDSIPVQSAASTNQQNLYKSPGLIHSSASASASAHNLDQGRNQGGYSPSSALNYELGGASDNSYHPSSNLQNFIPYEQQPPQQAPSQQQQPSSLAASSSSVEHSGSSSSNSYGAPHQQPSYTYYYQHYPSSSNQGGGGGSSSGGWSDGDGGGSSIFGDLGGLQLPSLGGGGLGGGGLGGGLAGLKGLGALGVIAKGILAVKPFLIIGLLILIALPVLFLLLPIPIVTITGQQLRSARSSQIATYLTQLSGKVLNSEECLERIICKLPQAPEKYQTRAKLIWDEYGTKVVKNERVSRGLEAYFEGSSQKNKNLKCNQKFKCSNKYL